MPSYKEAKENLEFSLGRPVTTGEVIFDLCKKQESPITLSQDELTILGIDSGEGYRQIIRSARYAIKRLEDPNTNTNLFLQLSRQSECVDFAIAYTSERLEDEEDQDDALRLSQAIDASQSHEAEARRYGFDYEKELTYYVVNLRTLLRWLRS